jgi:hypothetical protein
MPIRADPTSRRCPSGPGGGPSRPENPGPGREGGAASDKRTNPPDKDRLPERKRPNLVTPPADHRYLRGRY